MSKRTRNRNILIALAIIAVILVSYGLTSGFQGLVAFQEGNIYFLPQYTTIFCEELDNKVSVNYDLRNKNDLESKGVIINSFDLGLITSNVRISFYCGSNNIKAYVPFGCDYIFINNDALTGYTVNSPTLNQRIGKDSRSMHLNQNEVATVTYVGTSSQFDSGDFIVQVQAQPYGLRKFRADGLVVREGTCRIDQITEFRGKAPNEPTNLLIPPGSSQVIITSASLTKSPKDIINCNDEAVYITDVGGYYPTFEEQSSIYVDMRPESRIKSSKIQCVPSEGFCKTSDCATTQITDISPQEQCNKILGTGTLNYVLTREENGIQIECKRACDKDGKVITTKDCREIQICPATAPFRDSSSGECFAFENIPEDKKEESNIWLPFLIAGIGLLIATSLIIWRMRRRK